MGKLILVFVAGVVLSLGVAGGGHWITYSLMIRRYEMYKDAYIVISIIETLLVFPLASISTGVFVALLEPKRGWWLAGVSLFPLLGYWLYEVFVGPVLMLCIINESLAMVSAFLISRWRRKAAQVLKEQV